MPMNTMASAYSCLLLDGVTIAMMRVLCYVFVHKFLFNAHFDLEPDYIIRKAIGHRIQDVICVGKYWHLFTHHFGIQNNRHKIPKTAGNHASNSPFPLRHVDFHLTHECPGPLHSPRPTTARSLEALPHNDATNSPLVTMGSRKFTPKLPLPLRRSPQKSNTPIPSQTPLTPKTASKCNQPFATAHMCGQTDAWTKFQSHYRSAL